MTIANNYQENVLPYLAGDSGVLTLEQITATQATLQVIGLNAVILDQRPASLVALAELDAGRGEAGDFIEIFEEPAALSVAVDEASDKTTITLKRCVGPYPKHRLLVMVGWDKDHLPAQDYEGLLLNKHGEAWSVLSIYPIVEG